MTTVTAVAESDAVRELLPCALIADLKLRDAPDGTKFVQVLHGTTVGDGNGGEFYWSASSALTGDDFYAVVPTGHTGNGRWLRMTINGTGTTASAVSIAALKALPKPTTNNASITVLGYYTPGDGGGGEFYWDAASSASAGLNASNFEVVVPDAGGTGRWISVNPRAAIVGASGYHDSHIFTPSGSGAVARTVQAELRELHGRAFATIALLKAGTARFDGETVEVTSYYAADTPDGGGGRFKWDASTSAADNGGTIIAPDAGGVGRWFRVYSGAVNVRWFGAKGDGVTNDTAALQAAINAADANVIAGFNRQNTVLFPVGIYQVAGTLTFMPFVNYLGVRATVAATSGTGSGNHGSILRKSATGVLADADTGDMTIRDLLFVDGSAQTSTGIRFGTTQNASGIDIRGCRFVGFSVAINARRWNDSYVSANGFESNTTDILFDGANENQGLRFVGNVFFAPSAYSISLASGAIVNSVMFSANHFQLTAAASKAINVVTTTSTTMRGWSFVGNTFENATGSALANVVNIDNLTAPTVVGMSFTGNQFRKAAGVLIRVPVVGLSFSGNSTDGGGSGTGLTLGYVGKAAISANTFSNLANGIVLSSVSATSNTLIAGNTFEAVTTQVSGAAASDVVWLNPGDTARVSDYQQGTFTPTIAGATTAGAQTYAVQTGSYTKIGNRVFFNLRVALSAKDAATAGNVEIRGLPYTASAASNSHAAVTLDEVKQITYTAALTGRIEPGRTAINLVDTNGSASNPAYLGAAGIAATTAVNLSGHYFVD